MCLQGRIGKFVVKDKMVLGHESAGYDQTSMTWFLYCYYDLSEISSDEHRLTHATILHILHSSKCAATRARACSDCHLTASHSQRACPRDVMAVGDNVTSLAVGDRVALEPGVPCWGNALPRHVFSTLLCSLP